MPSSENKFNPVTTRFLNVIEEIIQTNKLLDVQPKNYSAVARLVYPSDRTIFARLKTGVRKKVPQEAFINLATHFNIDMNYIFYDGFQMNYVPKIIFDSSNEKRISTALSLSQLQTINTDHHSALALAMELYKKFELLLEKFDFSVENQIITHKKASKN